MSSRPLSIAFPAVGMFMDESVAVFDVNSRASGTSFVHSTSNLRIRERRLETRSRWIELQLEPGAPEDWLTGNTQGVIAYDPRAGFTPQNRTTGVPGMVESSHGKLFRITPGQRTFKVEDISSGIQGRDYMRTAWLAQGTSYVVRTDAVSPTQIWDGTVTRTSEGYNINAPAASRLPNFAGPVAYTDRFWIVNAGNEVIAGDHIHRTNPVGNDDVLRTTDQTYDITSTSFPAPASLGDILSMHIVTSARGGDLAAQAEIVCGTDGPGMWGVLSGTPRIQWSTTSMRRIVHPTTGPTGPYAAWTSNSELIFRTLEGITSIKYVDKETTQVGNPYINIGQEIAPLLNRDPKDLLLFASAQVFIAQQRFACTVWPVLDGPHRYHKGFVTAALMPGRTRNPEAMVWEGVNTLPAAMGEVIQFCEVKSTGHRRMFAVLRKADGTKGLAEWTLDQADDILQDGTAVPVQWQLLTRKLAAMGEYSPSGWGTLFGSFLNIRDKVQIRILARTSVADPFKLIWNKEIRNRDWDASLTECNKEATGTSDAEPIPLGPMLNDFKNKPWVQLLVQGTGCCTVDLAIGGHSGGDPNASPTEVPLCLPGERLCQFDLFKRS